MDRKTTARVDDSRELDDAGDSTAPIGLNVLHSPDAALTGTSLALPKRLLIGRDASGDADGLSIDDQRLSREHVVLGTRGAAHWLEDRASTNGTFVDGERVTEKTLELGAVIRIGDTVCELDRLAAPSQSSAAVGRSYRFTRALAEADRVAPAQLAVLLLGETGTGKEIFAHRIHEGSGRSGKLVAINCAAIPSTLMESYLFGHKKGAFTGATSDSSGVLVEAKGGTLFLDEIGELALELQAKLLRMLETGEFTPVGGSGARASDVRFISATNAALDVASKAGTFRADLYARLAGYPIHLPPLRARRCDVPLLARHFLDELAPGRAFTFTAGFVEALALYHWPMNVRELRTVIERLLIDLGDTTTLARADFVRALKAAPAGSSAAAAAAAAAPAAASAEGAPSKEELERLLVEHHGNIEALADHFGKHRQQIYRWLNRHGLSVESYRRKSRA